MTSDSIIKVTSEIGKLKKVLIHSPGGEMNNMLSEKREEWLIDDILDTYIIRQEHSQFSKVLLTFLDPEKICTPDGEVKFSGVKLNPNSPQFHASEKVIDTQYLLSQLVSDRKNDGKTLALIENIAASEKLYFRRKVDMIMMFKAARGEDVPMNEGIKPTFMDLVKTIITGKIEWKWTKEGHKWYLKEISGPDAAYIFKPIPNFIFTRDIGVTINNNLLITKTANEIRHREVVLMKYMAECAFFEAKDSENMYGNVLENVIEVSEDDDYFQYDTAAMEKMKVSFEGGDIMMVSERHLLIGKSQRTSIYAINKLIHRIFGQNNGIEIISIIQIAEKRAQMHIDTVLTQVRDNVWMLHGGLSKRVMNEYKSRENSLFQHNEILEKKGAKELSVHDDEVSILQFYCKANEYPAGDRCHADFYVYSDDELKELGYSEDDIAQLGQGRAAWESFAESRMAGQRKSGVDEYDLIQKPYKVTRSYFSEQSAKDGMNYAEPMQIEDLLIDISRVEHGVKGEKNKVHFVYSGGEQYPYDEREQWTDACNLLCLGNGVVIGYDRNRKTAAAFERTMNELHGTDFPQSNALLAAFIYKDKEDAPNYYVARAEDLFNYIEQHCSNKSEVETFTKGLQDLLITIPSGELSRARGGSHCMSMPLERK